MPVTPRQLTPTRTAQGKGAVGFSYEPARFVEVPPGVSGPTEAGWKGITESR